MAAMVMTNTLTPVDSVFAICPVSGGQLGMVCKGRRTLGRMRFRPAGTPKTLIYLSTYHVPLAPTNATSYRDSMKSMIAG